MRPSNGTQRAFASEARKNEGRSRTTAAALGAAAAFFPLFAIMVIGCWYADAEASIARATANFIMMTGINAVETGEREGEVKYVRPFNLALEAKCSLE